MKSLIKKVTAGTPIEGYAKNKIYDWETNQVMKKVLKKDSNCVDVGCHKGSMLKIMLKLAPKGFHYGFEPLPYLYDALVETFKNYNNVSIHNVALSDSTGKTSFVHVKTNPSYSGLRERRYDRPNEETEQIQIKTDCLDNLIPKDRKIDLIKIDVEGAEMQVLSGAKEIIKRDKPVVVFEHGLGAADHYGTTPGQLFDFLTVACGLQIALMESFLKGKAALLKSEFEEQFYKAINYYFVAF